MIIIERGSDAVIVYIMKIIIHQSK